jgi:hypothetical protein
MISKDVYSNKDSNRNRMAEERETKRYICIIVTALAAFAGIFLYYNYILLPENPIRVPPTPAMLEPAPPAPWTVPHDKAKPYDVNKAPYEQ